MSNAPFAAVCRLVTLGLALGLAGCKKDEPPPPLPEPPKPAETATAPLELVPEDAGLPAAPPPPAKPKTAGSSRGSLKKCCAALTQNAKSAPEPTKSYMTSAALICDAAAAQGGDKASVIAGIQTALRGAGLPADCK